jgi:hypothetical protein
MTLQTYYTPLCCGSFQTTMTWKSVTSICGSDGYCATLTWVFLPCLALPMCLYNVVEQAEWCITPCFCMYRARKTVIEAEWEQDYICFVSSLGCSSWEKEQSRKIERPVNQTMALAPPAYQ